ncbi:MAG TPA: hypothetical protein VGF70_16230 [Solirubrobacteraceae bacterium]
MEVDRALAAVTATINEQQLDQFDRDRVQEIVTDALGGNQALSVDDGGGLHDQSGARVGAIRRTPSGEWITERQNEMAERSTTAIPKQPPQSKLRKLRTWLKVSS